MSRPTPSRGDIESWLSREIARRLKVPLEEVDVDAPFSRFGLDSSEGVALQADLETWLGRELSPTLVWDHPTISAVARHLADRP